jgi:hypothetical protein
MDLPILKQGGVLVGLCNLLVKCNNFKVRMNACAALGSLPQRCHYANNYHTVWLSVVDGFENAANMPDFREFKHQDALIQQVKKKLPLMNKFHGFIRLSVN